MPCWRGGGWEEEKWHISMRNFLNGLILANKKVKKKYDELLLNCVNYIHGKLNFAENKIISILIKREQVKNMRKTKILIKVWKVLAKI